MLAPAYTCASFRWRSTPCPLSPTVNYQVFLNCCDRSLCSIPTFSCHPAHTTHRYNTPFLNNLHHALNKVSVWRYVRAALWARLTLVIEDGSLTFTTPPPHPPFMHSTGVIKGGVSVAMPQPCIVRGSPALPRRPQHERRGIPAFPLIPLLHSPTTNPHPFSFTHAHTLLVLSLELSPPSPPPPQTLHSRPVFIFSPLYRLCFSFVSVFVIILGWPGVDWYAHIAL